MYQMTNWSSFASLGGARVTTWNYDAYRGWLNSKQYPDSTGLKSGRGAKLRLHARRLQQRTWARGAPLATAYLYDQAGMLTNVIYSDSTPGVTNIYDRMGRVATVIQAAASGPVTTSLYYDLCGQLLSEAYSGGPLGGFRVTNVFDQLDRRTNLSVFNGVNLISSTAYAYDNASRLRTVSDGNGNTAGYTYVANSSLVGQIGFTNSGALRMTTTKTWDFLNRLTSISSVPPVIRG